MKATYGFRATMRARPGKGDELVNLLLSATSGSGPATNESCVVYLVGRSAGDPDLVHVTEGWTSKEAHAVSFAGAAAQSLIAKLAPLVTDQADYQDEIPVGGKLHAGGAR